MISAASGPASVSVREARDRYLARRGFTVAEYDRPTFRIRLLGICLTLPNPPSRQRAIPLHDLHHVATGYPTDLAGEAAVGAWELRCGCPSAIPRVLNLLAVLIGLFTAPRRTWRAYRCARGQRTLYVDPTPYPALLELSLADLRRRLGVPPHGWLEAGER